MSDTSSSTESPPKASAKDMSKEAHAQQHSPTQESFDEEYSGLYPKPKPGYTRRLIRMVRVPMFEMDENFDEDAWNKKVYGPDVIIVDMRCVPTGWILVDDPSPPPKTKIKKPWNPFDRDDPNLELNLDRAQYGLPPIDEWNLGVEYTYKKEDLW